MSFEFLDSQIEQDITTEERDFPCPKQYGAFKSLLKEEQLMHLKKNKDYSPANILSTGVQGIFTRMMDKMIRIGALIGFEINPKVIEALNGEAIFLYNNKGREPKNESLEDSLKDISVYAKIFILVRKGVWGK